MLEQNDTGALRLGRFKGGRTYFVNKYNEVCLIECACCKEIKPATAFHANHFKKFNKQNYCIACNDKRLSRKVRDKKDTPKEPKTTKVAKVVNIEDYRTEPVYIYLIPFGGGKVYIGRTNNISKRMGVHINNCKRGTHTSRYIQNRFNKNPKDVIKRFNTPMILYVNLKGTRELACRIERDYIDRYIDKGFMVLGGKY